jgi:hypothetical protein
MTNKVIELKKKHFIKEYKAKKKINYKLCFSDIETIINNDTQKQLLLVYYIKIKLKLLILKMI